MELCMGLIDSSSEPLPPPVMQSRAESPGCHNPSPIQAELRRSEVCCVAYEYLMVLSQAPGAGMISAGHHHTADCFGCSPTIVFGNGSSKGPKLVGNSRGSLTAAQKKFLKREYKKADGRMDGGVSPAWGKHALKAAKDSSAKLSSPSTRDIMEMIGRY